VQIFTFQTTFFIMVLVQGLISAQSYLVHQTALFAYLTEVVDDIERDVSDLNAAARVWEVGAMFMFMIPVIIVGRLFFPDDQVRRARRFCCFCPVTVLLLLSLARCARAKRARRRCPSAE
jgi:hypothetical protein